MTATMKRAGAGIAIVALLLAGCAKRARVLPEDPIERAATCGLVTAASERAATGIKGELSAEAQGRIFQYPLLAGGEGATFDRAGVDAVFKRMPQLFDSTIKGKWETLRPACAAAYPATQITAPTLPEKPLDAELQCYMLVDFMRKALRSQGAAYNEAATSYGAFSAKLDAKLSASLARAGIRNGDGLQARREQALADVVKLGQPPATIAACRKAYDRSS